jgi:hypothetical protein
MNNRTLNTPVFTGVVSCLSPRNFVFWCLYISSDAPQQLPFKGGISMVRVQMKNGKYDYVKASLVKAMIASGFVVCVA